MNDQDTTNSPPDDERDRLRQRVALLEASEERYKRRCAELVAISEQCRTILAAAPS